MTLRGVQTGLLAGLAPGHLGIPSAGPFPCRGFPPPGTRIYSAPTFETTWSYSL